MSGRIVGIVGYAQHGKDSVGRILVEEYGFTRYAFADQLKSMAFTLNPIVQTYVFPKHPERLQTLVSLLGWDKAKEIAEVRRFLQVLGTEAVRNHLGEDAWIESLSKRLHDDGVFGITADGVDTDPDAKVVITDVRFPNEAAWVRRVGGVLWRVRRVENVGDGRFDDFDNGLGTDHPSEKFVADLPTDRELVAASLHELEMQVQAAVG